MDEENIPTVVDNPCCRISWIHDILWIQACRENIGTSGIRSPVQDVLCVSVDPCECLAYAFLLCREALTDSLLEKE